MRNETFSELNHVLKYKPLVFIRTKKCNATILIEQKQNNFFLTRQKFKSVHVSKSQNLTKPSCLRIWLLQLRLTWTFFSLVPTSLRFLQETLSLSLPYF